MRNGTQYSERVPANTNAYLNWLNKHGFKCTFFVVGQVAELYPRLIEEIMAEGHELACHTHTHVPLNQHTPETFAADLDANLQALRQAGVQQVNGFRAPIFSLTEQTSWAYDVLKKKGFTYSSSVLPAHSPLFGWPAFGMAPKQVRPGLVELPMSVDTMGPLTVPLAGGIYFRIVPFMLSKRRLMRRAALHGGQPLLGYFHPYDIDTGQERFMHPGINDSRFYNFLMYQNRSKVFKRLDSLVRAGYRVCTYREYLNSTGYLTKEPDEISLPVAGSKTG
jgi:polysaccharide deacetylase family protein (PEP-CTERM system associated)